MISAPGCGGVLEVGPLWKSVHEAPTGPVLPWLHFCDCDCALVSVKTNVMWGRKCFILMDQKSISEELPCEFRSKCWELQNEGAAM